MDKIKEWKFDWEKPYLDNTDDFIFPNTFRTMRQYLDAFEASGTKPEFEIYDSGMINNLAFLINRGVVKRPVYLQFVLDLGGMPAAPENLVFMLDMARRLIGDFQFSVCAAGQFSSRSALNL